jgi:hypothetical protein
MASVYGDATLSTTDDDLLGTNRSAVATTEQQRMQLQLEHMITVFHHLIHQMAPTNRPNQQGRHNKSIYFPIKLYCLLEIACEFGFHHIISWKTHGRSFIIYNKELFLRTIAPK